jgi:DNA-binding GntR family transcriptional regulator
MTSGKSTSLTMQAYNQIRGDILACRLPPGRKLNISEICARLGVSLGAVREALSRLTSEGLVEAEPNKVFGLHRSRRKNSRTLHEQGSLSKANASPARLQMAT